ncbi:CDP-alcohol phosphatidyltransferase [Staphylothermus marinus F1]|uniref:Archaetidylinositol phosphate synthase n=1 Tax=Staphylothermus marinus (strain ATCC 43588 / DSM 3639 / JCM 9404 / F1) TaxID=399550 RepID=A3DNS1_STAMF|nr:archaetidylinositol phosphate synthase [Staphylothermus marinus]ABN70281.1 CDP-alcohol phosphatidyltransferase [Staphylothermus marinus F1]
MLTKLRSYVKVYLEKIGFKIARTGIKPNHITSLSLMFAFLAFVSIAYFSRVSWFILFIILSGLMDVLDGAVARASGNVTRFGGFLDSTLDRFSDALFIISLLYMGFGILDVFSLLIFSFMISYSRAKAESLNIKMEGVGIIERGERLLFIFLIAFFVYLGFFNVSLFLFYTLLALSILTVLQRIIHVYKETRQT